MMRSRVSGLTPGLLFRASETAAGETSASFAMSLTRIPIGTPLAVRYRSLWALSMMTTKHLVAFKVRRAKERRETSSIQKGEMLYIIMH